MISASHRRHSAGRPLDILVLMDTAVIAGCR